MTKQEKQVREMLISTLMKERKISRKECESQLKELEEFGLIKISDYSMSPYHYIWEEWENFK